jgi:hypothetical protein
MNKELATCALHSMCKWEDFTNQGPPPLFTEEFCHPTEFKKGVTTASILSECIGKKATECPTFCVFSNGAELIPDHPFCAPRVMVDDVKAIEFCTNADENSCKDTTKGCEWRKGKIVKANDVDFKEGSDLFASNFCHPPTTQKWDD